MIKSILNKIKNFSLLLTVFILTSPMVALAATTDPAVTVQQQFRSQLMQSIGASFFNNPIFSWDTGFIKGLFGIMTAIAFFQIVYRSYGTNGFLLQWIKTIVYMLIGLSILGGIQYTTFFPNLTSGITVKVPGKITLDTAVYFWLGSQFDALGDAFDAVGGPDKYQTAMFDLMDKMRQLEAALIQCNPGQVQCFSDRLKTAKSSDPAADTGNQSAYDASTNIKKDPNIPQEAQGGNVVTRTLNSSVLSALQPVRDAIAAFQELWGNIWPIPFILIKGLVWFLNIVRSFLNYFTLIVYALITAISLLFCKVITVFIVLPDFRGKVWSAYKMPLSTTMYGFLTSFIISMSTVIITGIDQATVNTILTMASTGNAGPGTVINVLFADLLAISSILLIQIIAMSKVPGLARNLWNLSLQEVADFGKTLIEAGFGVMKTVAGAGVAIGAAALTGGAALAGGLASGAGAASSALAAGEGIGGAGGGLLGGAITGLKSGAKASTSSLMESYGGKSIGSAPGGGLAGLISGGGGSGGRTSGGSGFSSGGEIGSEGGGDSSGPPSLGGGSMSGGSSSGAGRMGVNTEKKDDEDEDEDKDNKSGDNGLNLRKKSSSSKRDKDPHETIRNSKNVRSFAGTLARNVMNTAGGLISAGGQAALGKDVNLGDHFSFEGAVGHAQGFSSSIKGEMRERQAKKEQTRQNMYSFSDTIADGHPEEEVNVAEMDKISSSINAGTASTSDYSQFNNWTGNSKIGNLPEATQANIKQAQETDHYKEWNEIRQSQNRRVMAESIDRSGNVQYDSPSFLQMQERIKSGEMTRADLATDENLLNNFRNTVKNSKTDMENHTVETQRKAELRAKVKSAYGTMTNSKNYDHIEELKASRKHVDNLKAKAQGHAYNSGSSVNFYKEDRDHYTGQPKKVRLEGVESEENSSAGTDTAENDESSDPNGDRGSGGSSRLD
jgi:hypothetical protein